MAPPPPTDVRAFSGTRFVVLALIAMALFVTFLVVGSPVLLERTLERVPPSAPQTVETGAGWRATATQADEEGFVAQIYPRCIGCRYCMTACPYSARTFDAGHLYTDGTPRRERYELLPAYEYGEARARTPGGDESPVARAVDGGPNAKSAGGDNMTPQAAIPTAAAARHNALQSGKKRGHVR